MELRYGKTMGSGEVTMPFPAPRNRALICSNAYVCTP